MIVKVLREFPTSDEDLTTSLDAWRWVQAHLDDGVKIMADFWKHVADTGEYPESHIPRSPVSNSTSADPAKAEDRQVAMVERLAPAMDPGDLRRQLANRALMWHGRSPEEIEHLAIHGHFATYTEEQRARELRFVSEFGGMVGKWADLETAGAA